MIISSLWSAGVQDLDEDIGAEAIPEGQRITKETIQKLLTATSGACTATAIIDNGCVHVAGLGDCRVVLGNASHLHHFVTTSSSPIASMSHFRYI